MLKCNACGGTYEPLQADGLQYFHVCPPLSRAELVAAVDAGKVQLPAGETVDDALRRRTYERGNKRDENLKSTAERDAGTVKAEGAGVVDVPRPPAPVVIVR